MKKLKITAKNKNSEQHSIDKKLFLVLLIIAVALLVIWKFRFEVIIFVAIFFAFFFFQWKNKNIVKELKKAKKDIINNITHKKSHTILLIIILVLLLIWQFSVGNILLLMLFFVFLFYDWDSRYIAAMALMSLASCPFLLIFEKEPAAEQMAIYAYYFLVMTVVLQIAEYKSEIDKN